MTLAERLSHERSAWLCTLRPDGSAHVTPVWFVYAAETWWVGSRSTNVKVRNLRSDPRAVLTLESAERPVVAEGTCQILEAPAFPLPVLEQFLAKYAWNPAEVDSSGADRVLLRISVNRWLSG